MEEMAAFSLFFSFPHVDFSDPMIGQSELPVNTLDY